MFQAGNEFGAEFDELQYVMKQVMIIKVYAEDPKLMFDPSFRECRDIILRCFSEIIASGEGLQRVSSGLVSLCIFNLRSKVIALTEDRRSVILFSSRCTIVLQVECEMFPDLRHQRLLIRSIKLEENLVTDYMDKAMEIFKLNTTGPQKYLNTYKKYQDLLNNKAEQEVTAFLKETHSLKGFQKVCSTHTVHVILHCLSSTYITIYCVRLTVILYGVWYGVVCVFDRKSSSTKT